MQRDKSMVQNSMSHWGIGPKFGLVTALYGAAISLYIAGNPGAFAITILPRVWLTGLGAALLLGGTAVYAWSLAVLRAGRRSGELVTAGPYAIVRHPIYAAWILLIGPGVGLCMASWLTLTIPVVAYGAFRAFVREEERNLETAFGDAYSDYRRHTPSLLPLPHAEPGPSPDGGQ